MLAMSKTEPYGAASWEAMLRVPSRPRGTRARNLVEQPIGGEYRDRTGDLLVANQALSQLS